MGDTTEDPCDLAFRMAGKLPGQEKVVVSLQFGLDETGKTYSVAEIARILRTTKARVGQILDRALVHLALSIGDESMDRDRLRDLLIAGRMRSMSTPRAGS